MAQWDGERLVAEVRRLGVRGLPRDEYFSELGARLRRAMPVDAACWHSLDPHTLLMTSANPIELLAGGFLTAETEPLAARAVLASEYERDDYNTFATLARRRVPVGILSHSTHGHPERSARYREFLAPYGTPYEMRVAMVTRGRAWAGVVLHRTEGSGDFQPADARLMARLSRPIAAGVRASLLRDAAARVDDDDAPGMIMLGGHDEVDLVTPRARCLLEPLRRASAASTTALPAPVLALAATARTLPDGESAALHLLTGAGGLTLHASRPDGTRSARVAIVVQRASHDRSAALRLEAHGVSDREREVATLVARGLTTEALAERLFLSPWTVQDHLKSIFEKTGTRSRGQLRAQIFHEEFLPGVAAGAPLDANGSIHSVR